MRFILHLLITAVLLLLISQSQVVSGIHIASFGSALIAALVLGIVNFLVRPILLVLTLPITILTLGLFLIVINGLMLYLTSGLVHGFRIDTFGAAIIGGLLLGLCNLIISALTHRKA
jgi:putative membrane protein